MRRIRTVVALLACATMAQAGGYAYLAEAEADGNEVVC